MRNIENLVFKGGGVLGIAYSGAIQALEDANLLDNIKACAGTSAGSILATIVSLRYTAAEIKGIISATNFKDFEDHKDPLRIVTKYGLYKGVAALTWLQGLVKKKTGNENSTFADLASQGYRDLRVFATDLNTSSAKEFSNATTPNVIVAEAVRASMSIPLFFAAWQFPNNNPDDHIYVDGGMVYNYPITAFSDPATTLGFFLFNDNKKTSDLGYDQIGKYVKILFTAMLHAQDTNFEKNPAEKEITVKIDNLGISSTDFNLTPAMEEELYNSGKEATAAYINA